VSETDVLVLRPAAGPRRQVLTIAAVIAVVLVVAGVLAGGRPALITCISLVLPQDRADEGVTHTAVALPNLSEIRVRLWL